MGRGWHGAWGPITVAEMKSVERERRRLRWRWEAGSTRIWLILGVVGVAVVLIALLRGPGRTTATGSAGDSAGDGAGGGSAGGSAGLAQRPKPRLMSQSSSGDGGQRAAAVVANKVVEFSRGRRQSVDTLAERLGVAVPPGVDQFFAAVESGNWRDIKAMFHTVSEELGATGLSTLMPAIKETYAVAEAREVWPADDLLSYGQTVLASLKPGMVFVGGSQWGSAIPSLLNETSGEGRSVVLDQRMLSDPGYVEYLGLMYGDRLTALSAEDTERAHGGYLAERRERLKNNQLLPGETPPGDDEGKGIRGPVATKDVAEKLMLALLYKNPGMTVAMEKPSPGSPLYDLATPMGPIFEVRSPAGGGEGAAGVTPAQAEQSVQFWREAAEQLQSVPETEESMMRRRSMSDMAVAQANLLLNRSMGGEAEQTFRSAIDIAPMAIEPVGELAKYLQGAGRAGDAQQVLEEFLRRNPGRDAEVDYFRSQLSGPKG